MIIRRLSGRIGMLQLIFFVPMIVIVMVMVLVNSIGTNEYGMARDERIVVSTTTSLYDTGLWEVIEDKFEDKYGVQLDVISGGTGKALELGRRGDVDLVTVHDVDREEEFVNSGYGLKRHEFAYNSFLIVGPESDPALIENLSAEDAFRRIALMGKDGEVVFVSRGDESGTHSREKDIWRGLGYDNFYEADWYVEAGAGMGTTLMLAEEKGAYTVSDIGTFVAFEDQLDLVRLVDKGDNLRNIYTAIAVNPNIDPEINGYGSRILIEFLLSEAIQSTIKEYRITGSLDQLFLPIETYEND
ncbi:MAG: tungsten ABC transporter substrate-binding protein [Chloroflexi bacterium]|nr:tungsten ABC transporter substrate-binding protein [Chloroflexota bacterium]MQF99669.1 tungsten ABC transporter substrate-binding protein [SAR202 cluster bacterium]